MTVPISRILAYTGYLFVHTSVFGPSHVVSSWASEAAELCEFQLLEYS
jgi:hypothetical protein